jgi:hypothetical protein
MTQAPTVTLKIPTESATATNGTLSQILHRLVQGLGNSRADLAAEGKYVSGACPVP